MKTATLILLLFIGAAIPVDGQMAVGYNTDGNTLSLSLKPFSKFWGEVRVNTTQYNQASWSYSDRGITQAYFMARVFSMTNASLYAGVGPGANLLSDEDDKWVSINIPAGISLLPFQRFPNLYLTGEYTPMIVIAEGVPVIHSVSVGFRLLLTRVE